MSEPPESRMTTGRAMRMKVTITATGLPGRPRKVARPTSPKASGRPGLTARRQKWMRPRASTAARTWSSSPIETPPW